MGDVFFKLTAEEKQVVDAVMKIVEAQKKSEDGFKRMGRESDALSSKMVRGFADAGKGMVQHLTPGLESLMTLKGAGIAALDAINARFEKAGVNAAAFHARVQSIYQEAVRLGQVKFFPELENKIKEAAKGSTSTTPNEAKGLLGSIPRDIAQQIGPKGITDALKFGIKNSDAGFSKESSLKAVLLHAQLRSLDPKMDESKIGALAGSLQGVQDEPLSTEEMLTAKRMKTAGKRLDFTTGILLSMRKGGETGKAWEAATGAMKQTITDDDLKPTKKIRAESQAKLDQLGLEKERIEKRNVELQAQELGLDTEAGDSVSRRKHQEKERNAIQLERKGLNLRSSTIGVESDELRRDTFDYYTPEQQRLARVNAIPKEQREFAWLNDLSLLPPEQQEKGGHARADYQDVIANPPSNRVRQAQLEAAEIAKTPAGMQAKTSQQIDFEQRKAQERREKVGLVLTREQQREQFIEDQVVQKGAKNRIILPESVDRLSYKIDHWLGVDKHYTTEERATADRIFGPPGGDVQKVQMVDDQTKIPRVQPARNGGN